MKKKFPKAVLRTAEEMREAGPDSAATTPHPVDSDEGARPASRSNVIEMVPKSEAGASEPPPVPRTASPGDVLRRRRAVAIVERYANWCAVGGAIPVPIANAAALTGLLVRMIRSLSKLYGVPFEHNRTRAVVIGLMGGVLPTGLATVAATTVTYFVPGYGLLGLAASSVTSSTYARSIGQLYIEHFENGATHVDFRSIVVR